MSQVLDTREAPESTSLDTTEPAKPRKPGTFAPGVSGNPSGYPKAYREFVRLCRSHTVEALEAILSISRGEPLVVEVLVADPETGEARTKRVVERVPAATRLAASQYLIDRGWGKAVQPIEDREAGDSTESMSDSELVGIVRAAREARAAQVVESEIAPATEPDSGEGPESKPSSRPPQK